MKAKVETSQETNKFSKSGLFFLIALVIVVFVSAIGVIYSTQVSRNRIQELQGLQDIRDDNQVKWRQLLLEQSAWAAPSRIEKLVSQELKMKVPDVKEIRMVIVEQ